MTTVQTPPQNIGAEQTLLGAMLISDVASGRVLDQAGG